MPHRSQDHDDVEKLVPKERPLKGDAQKAGDHRLLIWVGMCACVGVCVCARVCVRAVRVYERKEAKSQ